MVENAGTWLRHAAATGESTNHHVVLTLLIERRAKLKV
jgi:hypothetical protein